MSKSGYGIRILPRAIMLKKTFLNFCFLYCSCVPLFLSAVDTPAEKKDPIKIAAIYSLTGRFSSVGVPGSEGAQLAVKEINDAGGVLGRPLQLILEDSRSRPEIVVQIVKKLAVDKDISIVIGLNDTDLAAASIPPLATAKKLFITTGATSPKLPVMAPGYVILACFGDNTQAAAAAEYSWNKLGGKTAYVLYEKTTEYPRLLSHYFKQSFVRLGGKIILEDSFDSADGNTNIKSQITKLKDLPTDPDIIYLAAQPEDVYGLIKEIRDAGFYQNIVGGDSYDTDDFLKKITPSTNDIFYTTHAYISKTNPSPKVAKFITSFQAAYNKTPETSFSAVSYDAVHLLAKAMQNAKSVEPTKVRDAFLRIQNYDGLSGVISYVQNNPIPLKTVFVIRIENGTRVLADKIIPKAVPKF